MTWFLCMRLWGRVCGFIYKIWAVTFQLHRQFWLLDRLGVWLIHLLIVIYREYCYFDFHNHMWNVEVIGRKSEISLSLDDHNYIIMCPNINWKMNVSTKVVLTWTLYRKIKHTHTHMCQNKHHDWCSCKFCIGVANIDWNQHPHTSSQHNKNTSTSHFDIFSTL